MISIVLLTINLTISPSNNLSSVSSDDGLTTRSEDTLVQQIEVMDSLYDSLYHFLALCYEPQSGGFYEDTLRKGNPKIESSARAITMLEKADFLSRLPNGYRQKMINYFQQQQDSVTGFFEDSQEQRDGYTRRGRAMGYSVNALKKLGSSPTYKLPQTDDPGMEHLQSATAFVSWLESLDWNQPWGTGGMVSSQITLINSLPTDLQSAVTEASFTWLADHQDTLTGWWGSDTPYRMLSGTFKLGLFYRAFNREMPHRERILASTLQVLEQESCRDACWVRNPLHLIAVLYPGYQGITDADKRIIVKISLENIQRFKRADGGFARHIHQDYSVTDGCSQAMKTRDALRQLAGLPEKPFPNGEHFLQYFSLQN